MKTKLFTISMLLLFCGSAMAQIITTADLEEYAKRKYGNSWKSAAEEIARQVSLDKNNCLTYQQVIECPGRSKSALYVAMNYWVTSTFSGDKDAIRLNDKEAGTIIVNATVKDIANNVGGFNEYNVSITPIIKIDIKEQRIRVTYTVQCYDITMISGNGWAAQIFFDSDYDAGDKKRMQEDKSDHRVYDEKWPLSTCYPFTSHDEHMHKRTSCKALVMTHAYSNVILDKVQVAAQEGMVDGDDDW